SGGAVNEAPPELAQVVRTDSTGRGELPTIELAGASVRFFASGYRQQVRTIVPGELIQVRLERASCLELTVVCDEGKPSSLSVVVTAERELFENVFDEPAGRALVLG